MSNDIYCAGIWKTPTTDAINGPQQTTERASEREKNEKFHSESPASRLTNRQNGIEVCLCPKKKKIVIVCI